MRIQKIYNNNVASATRDGVEVIVTGKGVAFGKKVGDCIESPDVEKIFILKDQQIVPKLEQLMGETPSEYIEIVDEIVRMLREHSELGISESIYLTLIDHIRISLEREKKGIVLPNPLLPEIRQYYRIEFMLACSAARLIEQRLGIQISEDETGFITLHIVNATLTNRFEDTMLVTHIIQDSIEVVEQYFQIRLKKETIKYQRFIRHLQFFARRVITGETIEEEDALYQVGCFQYPDAFQCVLRLCDLYETKYHYAVTHAEQGYLIYHIQNLLTEQHSK